MVMHQGRRSRVLTITPVDWQRGATVSGITCSYMYILYLRHKDAILAILYMGLRTYHYTVAGEWLNSLLFHDNIKYVATVWRKILTGEYIDEFDEFPAIHQ